MTAVRDERPGWTGWLFALAMFVGLPALVAGMEGGRHAPATLAATGPDAPSRAAPPPVEPVRILPLATDRARSVNAAVPFSTAPNPPARPFVFSGSESDLARATDCLAAAQLYEAGDDPVGQRAVAQVVLNRVRHPAFPKTVCGVVFQGQERATGCQFTFTCDGALARQPAPSVWDRARLIAREMLAGRVFDPVGTATHYHTDWVVPYWSGHLDKITAVGTHLFFRWRGWWGTPAAFRGREAGNEPLIARIAKFALAHRGDATSSVGLPTASPVPTGAAQLAARPQQAIGADSLGKSFGAGRLIAIAPQGRGFLLELSRGATPDEWPTLAQTFCAGRGECRIMAWRAGTAVPTGFPLNDAALDAMAFAYIHDARTGLQRALWNCAQTPRAVQGQCMRARNPAARAAAQPRPQRYETVRLAPMPTAPPTNATPAAD